ncbi:LysR substrate-binding domain-containing protein [Variovorax sp. DAIF25]|jgi:DNA-binding transcriptional LysR family regulator|uniref:LysR substrate-binding domain-containing protein n=1 Tax=Variovorax sp. DAIF25 TaxID=3080983 RepID=UPI003D6ACDF0
MNFKQIEMFRAVMLSGSMTLAAKQLHTSQPNVSRAIALLQRETQLKLFDRVGVRVTPTPEAYALMREVERSYVGLSSIQEAAARIGTYGVDGLRVAVSPALGISLLPRALEIFRKMRPGVPVVVSTADSATICKSTASGASDFGLAASVALPQEVDSELIHQQSAVCIVPEGHRLARKRKVKPTDLAGECFISMPSYDTARHAIDRLFDPEVRKLEIETTQASTICVMVARGLGVSIVNPLIHKELSLLGVRAIPFEPEILFRCYLVRAKHRSTQALVSDFIAAVDQVLR